MSDQTPCPSDPHVRLRDSWLADLRVLAPEAPEAMRAQEADLLLTRWAEPQRSYHTVQHLVEVLTALDELCGGGEVDAVGARLARIAAWYHDAVYDPSAEPGSNEHRSAGLARDHLNSLGVAHGNVDVVEALVLMTLDHDAGGSSVLASRRHTANVLHDADLWILSASQGRYREYAAQVRAEYAHLPDDLFARGRAAILATFAERADLYRTSHARTHWQSQARANVGAELDRLRG